MALNNEINRQNKALVLLHSNVKIKTPPLSSLARVKVGFYLRQLQQGDVLSLPISRPMPSIGKRCHELRINDNNVTWRVIYRVDDDAVVIAHIFKKKTEKTPKQVLTLCANRFAKYDSYKSDEEQNNEQEKS